MVRMINRYVLFFKHDDQFKSVSALIFASKEYIYYYNYDRIKLNLKQLFCVNVVSILLTLIINRLNIRERMVKYGQGYCKRYKRKFSADTKKII
ncbi:IS3 family transposase [Listeria welshimeri]|nr:IS3 family transposase [Listeria welshimeri]MBF2573938.1 IS3 family transposase [Listeria welshimeri]MBF2582363.1 IS3 family transposase [Listeria welshimeri]